MGDSIKVVKAALDDGGPDGDIVLRGVIDPSSLANLKVDSYQREILPTSKIKDLAQALRTGKVPDIEIGMRGGNYMEREGNFYLQDECFIVDGLQRTSAARELLKHGLLPRLGATIHFNTDFKSEQDMFRKLNVLGVKLSANVLLRNERDAFPSIEMLYRLCHDSSFTLYNRVTWDQRMKRDHLIGGIRLLHTALHQHIRFTDLPTEAERRGNYTQLSSTFERMMQKIGRNTVRENVKRYWEILDECFNVRGVSYSTRAPHLNKGFLSTMARVFANHRNFWADSVFVCSADLRKKISTFKILDPYVASLCCSSGPSLKILYNLIVDHVNSGKRTKQLIHFDKAEVYEHEEEEEHVGA